ncbi:Uncharacterised protein [uncultured archaeon]|nr:Uncharacterised protein [uncultured archaeon]
MKASGTIDGLGVPGFTEFSHGAVTGLYSGFGTGPVVGDKNGQTHRL